MVVTGIPWANASDCYQVQAMPLLVCTQPMTLLVLTQPRPMGDVSGLRFMVAEWALTES